MPTLYRQDILHPGFTKHVLDITKKDGTLFRVAVHEFNELEPEGSLPHNHPFSFRSTILEGEYIEDIYRPMPNNEWWRERKHRREGDTFFVAAGTIHKIVGLPKGYCITAVIQSGEPKEWKHFEFDPAKEIKVFNQ